MVLDELKCKNSIGVDVERSLCKDANRFKGVKDWDRMWEMIGDPKNKSCCFILGLDGIEAFSPKTQTIVIPKGLARVVQIILDDTLKFTSELELNLGAASALGIRIAGNMVQNSEFRIKLRSVQDQNNSGFVYVGRYVCHDNSSLSIESNGHLGEGAIGAGSRFDSKILKLGNNCRISCNPEMEILNKDCIAKHGFSSSRIPDDVLLYMKSRGIIGKKAEMLYAKGFLSGTS